MLLNSTLERNNKNLLQRHKILENLTRNMDISITYSEDMEFLSWIRKPMMKKKQCNLTNQLESYLMNKREKKWSKLIIYHPKTLKL